MKPGVLEGFAISPEQRRTWLQQEADGGGATYRAECVLVLDGVGRGRLWQALAEAVRRHEILRTRFERVQGLLLPVQVIDPPAAEIPLEVLTCRGDEEAVLRAAFDKLRAPLGGSVLRAAWVDGPARSLLCLSLPALCADAGTLRVLAQELAVATATGTGAPGEAPLQYADVAAWLNELLESARLAASDAVSECDRFAGVPGLPWKPAPGSSFLPRSVSVALAPDLVDRIEQLAAEEEAPGAAAYLACWQASLARLAGESEVIVGVAVEARRFPELVGAMGPLTRHLPARVVVDLRRSFRHALGEAREALRSAASWEAYCRWEGAAPVASRPVGLAAAFACEEPAGCDRPAAGALTLLRSHAHSERFVLKLAVRRDDAPCLTLHYDAGCVAEAEAARLVRQIGERLERAADDPGAEARQVLRPSVAERVRLTVDGNRTQAAYPAHLTLHGLFEAQVEREPHALAAIFEGRRLSFDELNRGANRLAHRLRRMGVGPDVPVVLSGERSLERLVAAVAILKAGGGYVPLDPANPPERLGFMLEDARAPLALAGGRAVSALSGRGIPVLSLETLEGDLADESEVNPPVAALAEGLAYVIYTSGSSGRPKGVMVSHVAIVNRIRWGQDVYPLAAEDRVLQSAAFGFDFSVWETFAPLAAGAAIVLPRPDGHRDAAYLARLIVEERVTTAHFVPSMLQVFLDEPGVRCCESLRLVFCGGEALPASLAQRFFEMRPGAVLYNQYGPTETTVDSTFHRCVPGDRADAVPIGRPVANTTAYVLDEDLEPAPEGSVGELCIGGAGLARGYLGRPDLTAASFVPDPYAEAAGARLYRTGDLARQRPDGTLEFLGRRDQQVKVRGARIEVTEIESLLLEHPGVREAAVAAPHDQAGESYLAAYVVSGGEVTTADLRAFLTLRLPDYMVPSRFVRLLALPRRASGKVDRRALPAPAGGHREPGEVLVSPRTPLEERLAAIFAEVLRLPQVGIHDDFFQLGGHSLLAMRLVSRVRESLAKELPLRSLFETPTVAGLAAVVEVWSDDDSVAPAVTRVPRGSLPLAALLRALEAASDVDAEARLSPGASETWTGAADTVDAGALVEATSRLTPRKRRVLLSWLDRRGSELGVFPLSFAQERLWVFERLFPGTHAYNVPVGLRLRGRLDAAALRRGLDALAARHEVLRTTYLEVDGRPFQVIAADGVVSFAESDLTGGPSPESEARRLATAEACARFDLGRGPLLRATLLRLADDDHVLVLVTHHVAFDGWSLGVLIEELSGAYRALAAGEAPVFADLPVQYADFAVWQRRYLDGPVLERQLAYWRGRLAQAPSTSLPTDRPAPRLARFGGGRESVTLREELSARVRDLGRAGGATPFMTLLAAFAALVLRYTRQGDVTVLSSVANRDRLELERVVGFFVNLVALRLDVSKDPSFRELLARVRETTLGAYAHQDVPFERVVEALHPARAFGQAPFSRVAFTLQGEAGGGPDFGALVVTPFDAESGSAKTDLTLYVVDRGDELLVSAEYNLDLFDRETVRRLLDHYVTLVESAVRAPDAPLSALAPEAGRDPLPLVAAALPGRPCLAPSAGLAERSNLTLSQLMFWLGQKLQPTSPIFNMVTTFAIQGRVDTAAFGAAVDAVFQGSDALRTVVREVDGVPQQSLLPAPEPVLDQVDLTQAPDPRAALERWVKERSRSLLPLASRPFEATLLKLAEDESVFYLAHHHAIADGWSEGLVWRRIVEAYEQARAGSLQPLVLPAFQEFVLEERSFRRSARYARASAYWTLKLAQPIEPLPFYGHLPQGPATHGRRIRRGLGPDRVARLRALAARSDLHVGTEDLTLLSFFGAALAAFLHRISGVRRLSIGLVYHNRYTRRLAETIGMLIEILPLHVTVEEDETFVSLAGKVARESLTVLKNGRHPIANPVQQRAWHAVLNYIGRAPLPALDGRQVQVEWVHTGRQDENLAVHVHPSGSSEDLVVDLDWGCEVLDMREAEEAAGHLMQVLDVCLADPGRRLDEAGLLGSDDSRTASLRKEVGFDF